VRRSIFALLLVTVIGVTAAGAASTDTSLDLGMRAFRAGDYASAAVDLQQASDALLTPDSLQAYVDTGRLDQLVPFETALVYLALAQFRLQREDDARDTVLRLLAAERFSPTYANLPLQTEAADFETLAAALVPSSDLPKNVQMAASDPSLPLPAVRPLAETVTIGTTIGRPERQTLVDGFTAAERERVQRQAAAQAVAAVPALTPSVTPTVTPAMPPTVMPVTTPAVATAVPTPDPMPAPAVVPERRVVTMATAVPSPGSSGTVYLTTLRQAEALADNGYAAEANRIYAGLASSGGVPREVVAEAAVGLYRTGAFRDAAEAFRRLGAFARGEEDLRYYNAVALYESGDYAAAQKELMCALPFIEESDDVARYRVKIEMSSIAEKSARNQ